MKYDIIVIGGGVAGAAFTDFIADTCSVLLLEKSEEDRPSHSNGIFPVHNYYFFDKKAPMPEDKKIFPVEHYTLVYSGKNYEGVIDGHEFGGPLGKICNVDELINFFYNRARKKGAEVLFNATVVDIELHKDETVVVLEDNRVFRSDFCVIATGSPFRPEKSQTLGLFDRSEGEKAFILQKKLGFGVPRLYYAAMLRFGGDPDTISRNIPYQYIHHYNRKISPDGPLFTTRAYDRFDIGVIHSDPQLAAEKLMAVLKKYNRVKNYLDGVRPILGNYGSGDSDNYRPVLAGVARYPPKNLTLPRCAVIGEAAGLVTHLFYEGLVGALASARYLTDVLRDIYRNNKIELLTDTSGRGIGKYDGLIRKKLVDTYILSSRGTEILFRQCGDAGEYMFNLFAKILSEKPHIRKTIYEALILEDLEKYNFANDRMSGEEIFKTLPPFKKLTYMPFFIKAMLF